MIEIRNLSRLYDGLAVVDDVSLTVETGQLAVLVGTSGSGKTTLMRTIIGAVAPTAGRIARAADAPVRSAYPSPGRQGQG